MFKFLTVSSSLLLILLLSFSSCKENAGPQEVNSKEENHYEVKKNVPYSTLFAEAEKKQDSKVIMEAFGGLMNEIVATKDDESKRKQLLLEGVKYAKLFKKEKIEANFYTPLLKDFPDANSKNYIFRMAKIMMNNKTQSASDVLFSNFSELYPKDSRAAEAKALVSKNYKNIDSYLKAKADQAFKRDKNTKIDKKVVQDYVNACEAYALSNPNGKMTAHYLYKGSELARSIKSFTKVMSLYDWIIEKYPNYEKTPTVQFLKGFILENEMQLDDAAKIEYNAFLAKYPQHELADDVKFLISNLGKSNDEILKLLGKNSEK